MAAPAWSEQATTCFTHPSRCSSLMPACHTMADWLLGRKRLTPIYSPKGKRVKGRA